MNLPTPSSPAASPALYSVLALMFNALVWGVSWWPLRALQASGLHPLWATAIIYTLSLLCTWAARPGAAAAFLRHPELWLLTLSAGLTNVCFNWAVTVGDVVRVVLLFYLMPVWAVLLGWCLLGERPRAGDLLRMVAALCGVMVVLKTPQVDWPWPQSMADWLGLTGGFGFALTNVLLRRQREAPAEARVLAMFGGGALMSAATAWVGMGQGLVQAPPAAQTGWLLLAVALSATYLAGNVALQYGAARLSSQTTALVMLSEVLFASGSSAALGTGQLTLQVWSGGALIVLAAAWSAWSAHAAESPP
jgi:drug/metabolite transporter (DMT)-like permease